MPQTPHAADTARAAIALKTVPVRGRGRRGGDRWRTFIGRCTGRCSRRKLGRRRRRRRAYATGSDPLAFVRGTCRHNVEVGWDLVRQGPFALTQSSLDRHVVRLVRLFFDTRGASRGRSRGRLARGWWSLLSIRARATLVTTLSTLSPLFLQSHQGFRENFRLGALVVQFSPILTQLCLHLALLVLLLARHDREPLLKTLTHGHGRVHAVLQRFHVAHETRIRLALRDRVGVGFRDLMRQAIPVRATRVVVPCPIRLFLLHETLERRDLESKRVFFLARLALRLLRGRRLPLQRLLQVTDRRGVVLARLCCKRQFLLEERIMLRERRDLTLERLDSPRVLCLYLCHDLPAGKLGRAWFDLKKVKASLNRKETAMARMMVYAALAVLRVVLCVVLHGMVHPDEFFQSQEIMARHVVPTASRLRPALVVPWEFQLPTPNRSILFPAVSAGIPYFILKRLGGPVTGWLLLVTPRLLLCALSFGIDLVLYHIVGTLHRHQQPHVRREKQETTLLCFASSWPTLILLCRPFSNAGETLVLALCFAVLYLVNPHRRILYGRLHVQTLLLASFVAMGFFIRFTFPIFFFPLGVELVRQQDAWFVHAARKKPRRSEPSRLARLVATVAIVLQGLGTFLIWSVAFVLIDTIYYRPDVVTRAWRHFQLHEIAENAVIAPINNLRYNLQYENLQLHGVHPRVTHVLVNMPMLFGPMFLVFLHRFLRQPDHSFFTSMCVVFPLACLSLAPHQEPRFMLPAILPLHLSSALDGRVGCGRFVTKRALGTLLWAGFNLALTLFFGLLHQGGVVPMLLSLSSIFSMPLEKAALSGHWLPSYCHFDALDTVSLAETEAVSVVFAKTYMPPRFLLAGMTPAARAFQFIDLARNDPPDLLEMLTSGEVDAHSRTTAFVVIPASAHLGDILPESSRSSRNVSRLGGCFPHVSVEDFALDKPFELELYRVEFVHEEATKQEQ
ncbi:hypothetical protein PsorP6_012577 [Peronosclerospora sorghi]|uniref:Uncharacterized protein n=1 Tax=Peronosclerospora sorghi TaxID=230839 RepID=A0ACC0WHV1_9STRA|nr:hypothetical protein PsorP6_012577 [Peronosclerospora sorghi]